MHHQITSQQDKRSKLLRISEKEMKYLQNVRSLCLGRIAFDPIRKILSVKKGKILSWEYDKSGKHIILCSYHPSRQNTQTGRLLWDEWNQIFVQAKKLSRNN